MFNKTLIATAVAAAVITITPPLFSEYMGGNRV